jgi:hypothetical protein
VSITCQQFIYQASSKDHISSVINLFGFHRWYIYILGGCPCVATETYRWYRECNSYQSGIKGLDDHKLCRCPQAAVAASIRRPPSNVQRAGRSLCFVGSHDALPIIPQILASLLDSATGGMGPRSQWNVVRCGRRAALPRAHQPAAPRKWTNKKFIATNL